MRQASVAVSFFFALLLIGCDPSYLFPGGSLSRPSEAHIDLSDDTLNKFDGESRAVLLQYLAGNTRWEIRNGRNVTYAIRCEKVDGRYKTTLNGFYSKDIGDSFRQTRVILAFDSPYGFGHYRRNITRAMAGVDDVPVVIQGSHPGTPGNSSYVIIEGAALFLEIYDQAPEVERVFTKTAFAEVCGELSDVLKHLEEIRSTGVLPIESRYPEKHPTDGYFHVEDGSQPGLYRLTASVNPTSFGYVDVKVFDLSTGERFSSEWVMRCTKRYVGWSEDGKTYFPYSIQIPVYEGDPNTNRKARFEMWHRTESGVETKRAETSRTISGWERWPVRSPGGSGER